MFIRSTFSALAIAVIASAAIGCGSDDSSSDSTADTTAAPAALSSTIGVKASEMKFALTADKAAAGKVTFNAENVGAVGHEMVVIKTDTAAADLPVNGGEVSEKGSIGEIGPDELTVGAKVTKSFDMPAGHYALICALPGHYQAGMYADFTTQ